MGMKLKRFIGIMFTLTIVTGMMFGMSITAFAEEEPQDCVITNETFSDYFDEDGYLKETVASQSTLDFQGTLSGMKNIYINKEVYIISTTSDATLDSNTNIKDDCISFNIVEGADYTQVYDLQFINCKFSIQGASHVTIKNIKMTATISGLGSGTGFFAIHSGVEDTVVKNSYFENGGTGSANLVVGKGSKNVVIENNTFEIKRNSGNVLSISTFLGNGTDPENVTCKDNTITIYNGYSSGIMYGIAVSGQNHVIEGNKIIDFKGSAITNQYGATPNNIIYKNNTITGDASMNLGTDSTVEGNYIEGYITVKAGDVLIDNTVSKGLKINGEGAQISENTITGDVTINNGSDLTVFTDNNVNGSVTVKSNGNKITGNVIVSTGDYAVILSSKSAESNTEVKDNALVASGKIGDEAIDPGTGSGNVIADNRNIDEFLNLWIRPIPDVTYTGKPIEPEVVVKAGKTILTPEVDYTVACTDNINAGKATVTVSTVEGSSYSGTATASFNILSADTTIDTVPSEAEDLVYTGEPLALVKAGATEDGTMMYALGNETEATEAYSESIPAKTDLGTYYVWYMAVGDDNHNDTIPDKVMVTITGPDKTELNAAIAEAEEFYNSIKDNKDYESIASTLSDAISAAKETAESNTVSAETVASAKESVASAKTAAEEAAAKAEAEKKAAEEAAKAAEEKKAADEAAAKEAEDKINVLPSADQVQTTDKAAIEEARKAYDALTDDQKKNVDANTLKKLTDIETALENIEKNTKKDEPADNGEAELAAAKEEAQAAMNEQMTVTQKGSKFVVKWKKSSSADGYYVYAEYRGKNATGPAVTIEKNTTTKTTITKINGKKISAKKSFYIYVVPYKTIDGKNVELGKSMEAHLVSGKNAKYSNVKKLTLKKSKYKIKVGKTAKIKAKVTLVNKNKKHIPKSYAAKFRYRSSDPDIATVDAKGKIKGIKKGTCTIYVYSVNGLVKKAKVTVK